MPTNTLLKACGALCCEVVILGLNFVMDGDRRDPVVSVDAGPVPGTLRILRLAPSPTPSATVR